MAFEARSLCLYNSVPLGTAGLTVDFFGYATADAVATVITDGYFNNSRAKLKVGSIIDAVCVVGGTVDRVSLKVVTSPATGNVTVAVNTDATGA